MSDDRPRTKIGHVTPVFEHPLLESAGSGRRVEHVVLPEDVDDTRPQTIIEPFGRTNLSWTLKGDCYQETASELDKMSGDVVDLVHHRHSSTVYIDDVNTSPQSVEDERGRRYTYTLTLTEVR